MSCASKRRKSTGILKRWKGWSVRECRIIQCKRSDCSDVSRKLFNGPIHPTQPIQVLSCSGFMEQFICWFWVISTVLEISCKRSNHKNQDWLDLSSQVDEKFVFLASKWQKWWQYLLLVHWQQLRQDSKYPHHSGPGRSACKIRHHCEKIGCRINFKLRSWVAWCFHCCFMLGSPRFTNSSWWTEGFLSSLHIAPLGAIRNSHRPDMPRIPSWSHNSQIHSWFNAEMFLWGHDTNLEIQEKEEITSKISMVHALSWCNVLPGSTAPIF